MLAAAFAVSPAAADPSRLQTILDRGVLRVGTTGDYRPFTYLDKTDGTYSGFDIDLAHSLGAALGVVRISELRYVMRRQPNLKSADPGEQP